MSKFSYDYHKQSGPNKVTIIPCAENIDRASTEATRMPQSLSFSKSTMTGMAGPIKDRNLALMLFEQRPEQEI